MYAIVYGATSLLQLKKLKEWEEVVKLFKNFLRSSFFVAINGFAYICFFCLLRHSLGHINFATISFLPGFLASLMAIFVERASRRPLLAIHIANIGTECAFRVWEGYGYVRPVRHGSVLLFSAAMAILGWAYHSKQHQPPSFLAALIKYFVGAGECGTRASTSTSTSTHSRQNIFRELLQPRHTSCPHTSPCLLYAAKAAAAGGIKGFLGSIALKLLSSAARSPASLLSPASLSRVLLSPGHLRLALFVSWFSGMFRLGACGARRLRGGDDAFNGAVAGALAALGMWVYPSSSLALYTAWKTLEVVCCMGVEAGVLPAVPYATEILYSVMTGYLFHASAMHQQYIKPSYWKLLVDLTDNRIAEFNRHLLYPYKMDSAHNFGNYWPDYNIDHLSNSFKEAFPLGLASIPT
ncbi:Transmembrane protein 135 N-terminal domain [Trinorchestia longiramus]|nr:Transmembrane protein 135 N-terminal domain [Trinorchestia longiramus]